MQGALQNVERTKGFHNSYDTRFEISSGMMSESKKFLVRLEIFSIEKIKNLMTKINCCVVLTIIG